MFMRLKKRKKELAMNQRSNNPIAEAAEHAGSNTLQSIGRGEGKTMLTREAALAALAPTMQAALQVEPPVATRPISPKAPEASRPSRRAGWGLEDEAQLASLISRSAPMSSPSLREDVNARLSSVEPALDISSVATRAATQLMATGALDQRAMDSGLSGSSLTQETFAFQFAATLSNEACKELARTATLSGSEPALERFAQGAMALPVEARSFAIDYFKAKLAGEASQLSEPSGRRRALRADARQALASAFSAQTADPQAAQVAALVAMGTPELAQKLRGLKTKGTVATNAPKTLAP
jgi:hypothetical protein